MNMKRIALILLIFISVSSAHAKSWKVVSGALSSDTLSLIQDEANPGQYKFVGKLNNKSFKLFDGADNYIPVCGLSDPFDQQIGMEKQLDVSQSGFRISYTNPSYLYRITLTDGTAPKIIVEKVVPFDKIYLIGGPVNTHNPNWLLSDARELQKDPANPFVFYYKGFLKYNTFGDERGSIKFLTSNMAWDPAFHPLGTSNVALAQATKMRLGGSDTKWEIPADGSKNGYYEIKLNTLDETITIEKFEYANVDFPGNIFIAGDAMPCGWVNGAPEVMNPTNILEGKYSWTGNVVPGQFKFLKTRGSWGSCYVSTIENQPIVYGKTYPVVYEFEYYNNGGKDYKFVIPQTDRCVINLDLVSMTIVVNKESQNGLKNNDLSNDVAISTFNGKVKVDSFTTTDKHFSVLTVDGREIYQSTFVSHAEVALAKGYYVVKITDRNSKLSKTVGVIN